MGFFSTSHHTPLRDGSISPTESMTEMTDYSESAHSREARGSERVLSSGASFMTQSTSTGTIQSSYSSRKGEKAWVHDINKHSLMAKHLYRNCKKNTWVEGKTNEACIALRTFQGEYIVFPPEDRDDLYKSAVRGLNVEVMSTMKFTNDRSVSESTLTLSKLL
jgi:hypothetical protein